MMAHPIPIANLYYLLSYAWNHRLSEADLVSVDADSCPDLNNFFARLLAASTHHLLRRGLDLNYFAFEEETPRIRGRIDFSASEKYQTRTRGKLVCLYDELSPDALHNRIIKATLRLLLADSAVLAESRRNLRKVFSAFGEVGDLKVRPQHFHRVQLHRNNRAYRFILHLCELVHSSLLPDKSARGALRFRDFTRDENIMAKVFEDFVRNFAIRGFPEAKVSSTAIAWQVTGFAELTPVFMPKMLTDVTIEWDRRKLILDCKYYAEALVSWHGSQRFRSANLYQLHAYITNKAAEPGWDYVEGMLLYPSNGYSFDHTFVLHKRHRIRISTIDLSRPWPEIDAALLDLIGQKHAASQC